MLVMAVAVTTITSIYRELHVCQGLNPVPSPNSDAEALTANMTIFETGPLGG